jgi:hypothetical protein
MRRYWSIGEKMIAKHPGKAHDKSMHNNSAGIGLLMKDGRA